MKRVVVFDLDDTLVDTTAALEKARLDLVHEMYGAGIDAKSALRCWRSASEWFGPSDISRALQCVGVWHRARPRVSIESIDWLGRYEQAEASLVELMPNIRTLLNHLHSQGYDLAVVTNGNAEQQWRKFRALNFNEWFSEESFVICDGRRLPPKPAPDAIVEVLKKLGVSYGVVVGDRRSDMIAGSLAGCANVRILRKSRVARQGPLWLKTIGDPDLAVSGVECEKAIKQLFDREEASRNPNGSHEEGI